MVKRWTDLPSNNLNISWRWWKRRVSLRLPVSCILPSRRSLLRLKISKVPSTSSCLFATMRRAYPWPQAGGASTIKPKSCCGYRMSLSRTRGRIKSWYPGPFPSVALNPWRRCICQNWWRDLKKCIPRSLSSSTTVNNMSWCTACIAGVSIWRWFMTLN